MSAPPPMTIYADETNVTDGLATTIAKPPQAPGNGWDFIFSPNYD